MKKWIIATFLLCFLIPMGNARAEYLPEIRVAVENQHVVAIFPPSIPVYLYKNVAPSAQIDMEGLRKALVHQGDENPYIRVLSVEEMTESLKSANLSQTDAYMQAEIDMGYARDYLNNMKYTSAIELTRKVIDNYQKSYMRYVQPQIVAAAYQQLAYALIGKYQENPDTEYELLHPARLAFMELFRLAPYLSMIEGRQAKERVKLYNEAMELFLSGEVYRQTPLEDAAQMARLLDADLLYFPRVVQEKSGDLILEVDQYTTHGNQMTYLRKRLVFPANVSPDAYAQDIVTWLVANSYVCINDQKQQAMTLDQTEKHRFFFDLGVTYSSYIRFPTDYFPNIIGAQILFSYKLNKYFFLRGGTKIAEVLQDKAHELLNNFEVYEFMLSVGLMKEWQWVKLYLDVGLNMGISSAFTLTTSTACKTFGLDDIDCNASDVTYSEDPFSLNLEAGLGVSAGADPFFASLEAYIVPTLYPAQGKLYRHGLGLRLSLQYWF